VYISSDNFYDKNLPARSDQIYNSVSVQTQPIAPATGDASSMYSTMDAISVPAAGLVQECVYSASAVTDATATITEGSANISIASSAFYCWGAVLTLANNDSVDHDCKIEIKGREWVVAGEETFTSTDASSITIYGVQAYDYPVNRLIQSSTLAKQIADELVASFKNVRKDITLQWRGDPALEIRDLISVKTYNKKDTTANFSVYKNKLSFDGYVKETTEGRITS